MRRRAELESGFFTVQWRQCSAVAAARNPPRSDDCLSTFRVYALAVGEGPHRGRFDLQVSVLGPLQVRCNGAELSLGGPKERAVLAVLAGHPGRTVPVPEIVTGVWGDDPPRTAEKTLQSYVMRLRRALRSAGATENGPLVTDPAGYRLAVPTDAVDAVRFEHLVGAARQQRSTNPTAAAATYREALALWRGPAYAGLVDAPPLHAEATRLEELHLVCLEECLAAELDAGRADELIPEIEAYLTQHPLRERLWEALLLAMYRAGRQAEALEAFQRARSVFRDELGLEPGPRLRTLQAQILAHDPALSLGPIFTVDLPVELATTIPPLADRQGDLAWLAAASEHATSGAGQLVLVDGGHGIGKTRLLAEFARDRWAAGSAVLYTSPTPAGGPYLIMDQLASALGESGDQAEVVERGLSRLPPGPVLIVVDDVHRAALDGVHEIAKLARTQARPLLTVLVGDIKRAPGPVAAAIRQLDPDSSRTRRLPPLDVESIEALLTTYVDPSATEELAQLKDAVAPASGVPLAVHDTADAWVREQAARQVAVAGELASMERAGLLAARGQLASGVLHLTRARLASTFRSLPRHRDVCPYPGLAAFEADDAEFFWGRERALAELTARLAGARVVALVGASGSGKSSLLRAGLIPALHAGALPGSQGWRITLSTPAHQRNSHNGAPAGSTRLSVVDQFEEVFAAEWTQERRTHYIQRLLANADVLVLAIRADHLDGSPSFRRSPSTPRTPPCCLGRCAMTRCGGRSLCQPSCPVWTRSRHSSNRWWPTSLVTPVRCRCSRLPCVRFGNADRADG
jgi:DNA-binding SARP family transcriptional activator